MIFQPVGAVIFDAFSDVIDLGFAASHGMANRCCELMCWVLLECFDTISSCFALVPKGKQRLMGSMMPLVWHVCRCIHGLAQDSDEPTVGSKWDAKL